MASQSELFARGLIVLGGCMLIAFVAGAFITGLVHIVIN